MWADQVIVADQGSVDGTINQVSNTKGVKLVINDAPSYDESHRQRLLIKHAREVSGEKVLIALDADEALSANCLNSKDWERIANAKPGTVLRFKWVNILPGFQQAWIPKEPTALGFIDDGSEHSGQQIHSRRIPWPSNAPVLDLEEIVVLHFQYVVWERVISKHRWYQVWERLNHPNKTPLEIFRQYHHMYGSWGPDEIHPLRPEWLDGFVAAGVDFSSLACEPMTWWDQELVTVLRKHGPERFRKIAIWDQDWNEVAGRLGFHDLHLSDPRSLFDRFVHRILKTTQNARMKLWVRGFEYVLRRSGW